MPAVTAPAAASSPWVAPLAIAGASVVSGLFGGKASDKQAGAAEAATAEDRRQFNLTWGANAPFREGAQNALGNMALLTGEADPRIEAANSRKQELVNQFRSIVNSNTAGEVYAATAANFGVDRWQDVTDEMIIDMMSSESKMAEFGRGAQNWSELGIEMRGLNDEISRLESSGGGQTVEEMVRNDPSYEFRLKEGNDAVANTLSAQNRRLGGSALKAVSDYNQDFASTEYSNIFNRNATIAGYGAQANQTPQNNISGNIINQGNAGANKYSAYNEAIQGGIQNYLTYDASKTGGGGGNFSNYNGGYKNGQAQGIPYNVFTGS